MTAVAPAVVDDIEAILAALPTEEHRRAVRVKLAAQAAQIELDRKRAVWLTDPQAWATERLGVQPWSKQVEIMASVRDHKRTVVRSCNSMGKSFTGAMTIAWWIDTHPPGTAFVVSTAPTFAQVRAILWREVRSLHRRAGLMGRVNQTEWVSDDGDIVGYGRKPADQDAVSFLGIHARYVLVVIDEACGVPVDLWDATESIATNDASRILAIGNPDDPGTEFANASGRPDLWHIMKVSAFDTPNLTGEPVSEDVAAKLVSKQWVEDRALAWGIDSPLYVSRVLAEFPTDASDRAVRLGDVLTNTVNVEPPYRTQGELLAMTPVVLGVDVGGGGDETSIRERRGTAAYRSWHGLTPDPKDIARLVVEAVVTTGARIVNYDSTGIGWAIGEVCAQALRDVGITGVAFNPINFGASANESDKYKNMRAEMVIGIGRIYSQKGDWYLGGMVDSATGKPDHEDTIAQLVDQKYSVVAGGRLQVEPKVDIIKRTGRSPDDSDALLLAFTKGTGPARIARPQGQVPTGAAAVTRPQRRAGLPSRAGLRTR